MRRPLCHRQSERSCWQATQLQLHTVYLFVQHQQRIRLMLCVSVDSVAMCGGVCAFKRVVHVPVVGPEYCAISSTLGLLGILPSTRGSSGVCTANTFGLAVFGGSILWILPVLEKFRGSMPRVLRVLPALQAFRGTKPRIQVFQVFWDFVLLIL